MKRALITGGAGFIGTELTAQLLSEGWTVHVVDDFSGASCMDPREHGSTLCHFNYCPLQSLNRAELRSLVSDVDVVFHLAATLGVQKVIKYPANTIQNNIATTQAILETCLNLQRPILLASSSEVYGRKATDAPLREDMELQINPDLRWGYAAAKLLDEFTALSLAKQYGLRVIVARIFNTIGPRQSEESGMVVPSMMGAALRGEQIVLNDGGNQYRSFCDVRDTAAILKMLVKSPSAYDKIVNVGNPSSISIKRLATLIATTAQLAYPAYKHKTIDEAYGYRFADIQFREPDITRLRSLIGPYWFIPLESSLGEIFRYRRSLVPPVSTT